jgi:SSS family solute:Na+ symporter
MSDLVILWLIVAGYATFIFIKGVSKARLIKSTDDYLVAGRNIGWFALFCTMGATVVGGGASIGAIGRTYEWGILMLLVSTGWYLHFIFSGLVVAPKFRRATLYTVAGYFGHRFDERSRFVVMVLSLLFSVFIIAAQVAAFGTVLSSVFPASLNSDLILKLSIIIGGALVVIYSTAGGLLAVVHTDVYQFIILIFGFALTAALCIPGLMESWSLNLASIPESFFHPHGGKGWMFLITTFLAFFFGETFAPGYATRYCIGKNTKQTKIGIAGVGFFLAIVFPIILFVIALFARINFPLQDAQQALPLVIKELNNPFIGGVIIGALLMAVMSSADSALNSATAIFVKDLFEHQLGWEDDSSGKMLKVARYCTFALGTAAIAIAVIWSDIIDLLLITYHIWAPAIIVPVAFGAIWKYKGENVKKAVFWSMIIAVSATLIYKLIPYLQDQFGLIFFPPEIYEVIRSFDAAVFGVGVSLLVFTIFILAIPSRRRDHEDLE